jgi:hypothetical protein
MQVEIKFKRTGSNSVYGSFQAGDIMRCAPALAAHYVSECLAKYVEPPVVSPTAAHPDTAPAKKPKRVK